MTRHLVVFDVNGTVVSGTFESTKLLALDCSSITSDAAVDKCVSFMKNNAVKVTEVAVHRSKMDNLTLFKLITCLPLFRNLIEINLSFLSISDEVVNELCANVNATCGFTSIKKLVLTSCSLGTVRTNKLFDALCGNVILQELVLTSNSCSDGIIPHIKDFIMLSDNDLKVLAIGGNNITNEGLVELCDVLRSPGAHFTTLLLNSHSSIGCGVERVATANDSSIDANDLNEDCVSEEEALDTLFLSLQSINRVSSLSLANCTVRYCGWGRFLPFMTQLNTLVLAHNRVGDDEMVKLCATLENCMCLMHLDLSYNLFGRDQKVCCVQKLLESNCGLMTLNLSGNRLADPVWSAVMRGLLANKVLNVLDLSECGLSERNALVVCEAYQVNDTCFVRMHGNPLHVTMFAESRQHCIDAKRATTIDNAQYLLQSESAAVRSMEVSAAWREERLAQIMSVGSLTVASDLSELHQIQQQQDAQMIPAATTLSGGIGRLQRTLMQAEQYLSTDQLQEVVDAADESNTVDKVLLDVCYGRYSSSSSHLLGAVTITSRTTYSQASALIRPLLADHLQGVDANLRDNLINNFTLFDPFGAVVEGSDTNLRQVWPELCQTSGEKGRVIEVRPANWMTLPPEDSD